MKKLAKIFLLLINLSPIGACIMVMTGNVSSVDDKVLLYVVLTILFSVPIQMVFYTVNVFRNTTIAKNQKGLWVLLLLSFNFAAFPFYWYLHIWRGVDKPETGQAPEPLAPSGNEPARFRNKSFKITLLLAGFLPILFFILSTCLIFLTESSDSLAYFFGILFFVSLVSLTIFYVFDVYRNSTVASNQRMLWTIVLIIGSIYVFPLYWYLHIWKKPHEVLD